MTLPLRRTPPLKILAVALLAALAAGLVLAVPLGDARADNPRPGVVVVNADVMVLLGTQAPGGGVIDPAIGNVPQLRKPPFSAYNTYRLLDRRALALEMGRSSTYTLANGRVLQVTFVEPTPDHGYHVRAAINQPGGGPYLKLLELTARPNEPFFVAGQPFLGGTLILAITLRR